jgi:Tfp pilus assembly protein PilV
MIASARRLSAFSLVEVTLALGIISFSLLALFGLLATGSRLSHTASEQTASVGILSAVVSDLRATPKTVATSLQFGIPIPATPGGGSTTTLYLTSTGNSSTALGRDSRYRLIVTFLPNSGTLSATLAELRLTWPAAADPTNANTEASEFFLALDRG